MSQGRVRGWLAAMADLMGLAGFARARSWVSDGMAMRPWQRVGVYSGVDKWVREIRVLGRLG